MPVSLLQEFASDPETYDKITQAMGVAENPPEGIVFHTAAQIDGGIRIFDVWESREQLERFLEERVAPAVAEVMGGQGGAPTRHEVVELHNFIRL